MNEQADVVRQCFGVALADLGRGFYVTLELLAILRGMLDLETGRPLLDPHATGIRYVRRSHDFARRMPHPDRDLLDASELEALEGEETRPTLAALVDALVVPFPGRRGIVPFKRRHLYPYVGELIHYDAVDRLNRTEKILVERYTFRGGGALAYRILASDPDEQRRARNEGGLRTLVADSGSTLGRLANALRAHDVAPTSDKALFEDETASGTEIKGGGERWVEELRVGVSNIVGRRQLTHAKRVEMLMHWAPFCIARYQLDVATTILGRDPVELPIDLRSGANTIRSASQAVVQEIPATIGQALALTERRVTSRPADIDPETMREVIEEARAAKGDLKSARAFFLSTMWTVGALNAGAGTRHLSLKLPMIEALVGAGTEPGRDMSFHAFCNDVLFERYRLLIDPQAARRSAIGDAIDAAEFDENREVLARRLAALGLLTEYSDATRIVHAEVRG